MKLVHLALPAAYLTLKGKVSAHGANRFPPSRQWQCSGGAVPNLGVSWGGGGGAKVCDPAVTGDGVNNVIVDWSSNAQGSAKGWSTEIKYKTDPRQPHIDVMGGPDAFICSAMNSAFEALDHTSWTVDQNDPNFDYPTYMKAGPNTFSYACSASHRTQGKGYLDVYITKDGWDDTKELTWNDLEATPFCHYMPDTYPTPLQVGGPWEDYPCDVPENKVGKHVMYVVWQRDDSPEAFYSCSDVVIESDAETTTTTKSTTTTGTSTTDSASTTTDASNPDCTPKVFKGPVLSDGTIRPFGSESYMCMYAPSGMQNVYAKECDTSDTTMMFSYDQVTGMISSPSGNCWAMQSFDQYETIQSLPCNENDVMQKFYWNEGQLHAMVNYRNCVGYSNSGEKTNYGYPVTTMPCFANVFGSLQ